MEIKILGTGCPNCKTLEKRVRKVIEENNLQANLKMISDLDEIMSYNILSTPVLIIDDEFIAKGTVPSVKSLKKLLIK